MISGGMLIISKVMSSGALEPQLSRSIARMNSSSIPTGSGLISYTCASTHIYPEVDDSAVAVPVRITAKTNKSKYVNFVFCFMFYSPHFESFL